MATITKTLKEKQPAVKLIGKQYTDADRDQFGGYGAKWQEWFQNGYFDALQGGGIEGISDDFVGVFRCINDVFEYWIGCFMNVQDEVPAGYQGIDLPAADLAVCYVYGKEDTGELYGLEVHEACLQTWSAQGWQIAEDTWFVERYNCPRFTTPDEHGNVILDYCAYLAQE